MEAKPSPRHRHQALGLDKKGWKVKFPLRGCVWLLGAVPRPRQPLCPGGFGAGFYIRFSSFMISHTLIQLDNQREKPTQLSTQRGLGRRRREPGGHRSPREFGPLGAKNDGRPKVGQQGRAPVPWNATPPPPLPTQKPQSDVAPPKRSRTPKWAQRRGLGVAQGREGTASPPRLQPGRLRPLQPQSRLQPQPRARSHLVITAN